MSVRDLIEILNDVPNKDIDVTVQIEGGFISACMSDTGEAESAEGERIFVIMPCFCHATESDEEEMTIDLKASDFDEAVLN